MPYSQSRRKPPAEIERSLEACWKEGIPSQIMISTFDYYLIPLGIFLGATSIQIGLLVSLPSLVSSLSQFANLSLLKFFGSRLRLILALTFIQALLLVPVGILPILKISGRTYWLIVLIVFYRILSSLIGPAWGSLVSGYLPEDERGRFFGWRSRIIGIAGILGVSTLGLLLYFAKTSSESFGFVVLFLGTALLRFISLYYMTRMVDLPDNQSSNVDFTFWMFIRRVKESNFVKYILYLAGISFATQLSAPFFSIRMLKELNYDYISYTCVHLSSVLAGLIAFPLWAKHADLVGNKRVLKLTGWLLPLIPIFWSIGNHPASLMVVEFFSGFVWSGFNFCSAKFIFDAVSKEKRIRVLSYSNVINGVAIFIGAISGGFLATHLPPLFGSSLIALFLFSAVVRFAVHIALFSLFKEVRETTLTASSSELFLSVLGIRPISGLDVDRPAVPPFDPLNPRNLN